MVFSSLLKYCWCIVFCFPLVVPFQFKCEIGVCILRNFSPKKEGTFVYTHIPHKTRLVIFNFRDRVIGQSTLEPYPQRSLTIRNSPAVRHLIIPQDCRIAFLHIVNTRLRIIETSANVYLKQLTIDHSRLSEIPSSLKNLQSLFDLTVWRSPIKTLDLGLFCDMKAMSIIRISYTYLRSILNSMGHSCQLTVYQITLTNNKLHTLDFNTFDSCPMLTNLDLKSNQLQVLTGFMRNQNIKTVILMHNQIHQVDFCQWHTPSLYRLHLDDNVLSDLPSCLTNISSIKNLNLDNNCFTHFDVGWIGMMETLDGLYISFNKLSSLQLNRLNFPLKLSTIDVQGNKLTHLDLSYVEIASLYVDARNNTITSFDVNNTSSNVTTLLMDGNPIDCSWSTRKEKETVKCKFGSSIRETEVSSNSKCTRLL